MTESMTVFATAECTDALLPVVGAGLPVPLVTGASVPYANLDYAASAPALRAVAEHLATALPYYASVHRAAGRFRPLPRHRAPREPAALAAARRRGAGGRPDSSRDPCRRRGRAGRDP